MKHQELARKIRETGFSCTRCGVCCTCSGEDENLVMVTPEEIDRISGRTGESPDRFTEPYPESVESGSGGRITFERCLRRSPSGCTFLSGKSCTVYPDRPWICRTYPFMLDGDELRISACNGLGKAISEHEAEELACLLIMRREVERMEEEQVRQVLASVPVPPGKRVLIDGRGMSVIR
jgi:Fe-S-cluster containining protein